MKFNPNKTTQHPFLQPSMIGRRIALILCGASLSLLSFSANAQDYGDDLSDVYELEPFTVRTYKDSLREAIQIKRQSALIVDAVSAEDIGKFPDINVAESLSHLTGVTVDRQFGEGEKVSILGTDPALNRVLINGQTIASGDWGGNPTDTSGRTFNYTLLSPEIVSRLELFKSTEARIDEGSIGGTVIVHTHKPLNLDSNTLRASLGYSYNDRSEQGNVRGSALYSWKNEEGNFGALVSLTHDKEELWRAGIEYWGAANKNLDGQDYTIAFGMNSAWFNQKRERDGIQAVLEWMPSENLDLSVTAIHIEGVYDNFSQSRYVVPGFWGTLDSYSANSDNFITSGHVTAAEGEAPYAANGQFDTNLRKSEVNTDSLHFNGEYVLNDWNIKFDLGTTKATGGKDPEYLFSTVFNEDFSFSYSGESSSLQFDDASAALNPGTYKTRKSGDQAGGIEYTTTEDEETYAQIDFTKAVDWGSIRKIFFGAKITDHDNEQDSYGNRINVIDVLDLNSFEYTFAPSGLWDGIDTSGDAAAMVTPTQESVVSYLNSLPAEPWHEKYGNEWQVNEVNKAAYMQAEFGVGALTGNAGLRVVNTETESNYWNYNSNTAEYTKAQSTKDYTKVLPSLNLNYEISEKFLIRLGLAKVVARPRYSDLAGQFSLDDQRLTGGGGNPDLDPYESNNLNLVAEYYFAEYSGLISAEFFVRDITNYILSVTEDKVLFNSATGQNATYSVSSPFNAGSATVKGFALNIMKELPYGFGIQANYTYAKDDTTDGYNMPYLSENTFNIIPYYENGPITARLSYSWRSEFFTSIGRLNLPLFADSYEQLDASVSYDINENFSVTLNAANLIDDTYFWYYKTKYAPMGVYKNGRKFSIQATMSF